VDWARDHLGNDVPAWRGGISGFGLVCPSCGEPVRRRAGGERRPHFAHYSHRAKPDCDNYFPSQGAIVPTRPGAGVRVPAGWWKRESLSCGLFLVAEPGRASLTLWLRVPPMDLEASAEGRLEIQSGLGHRAYDLADLRTARLVPMVPQVPLAVVAGFGGMLPLAAHVAGQVGAFAADRNLFYADEKSGRFVFGDEPLEWGAHYRMLSAEEVLPPLDLGLVLNWKPEGKFGGWNCYEMGLPASFVASKPYLPANIAAFLQRRIRRGRPRLYVVDPFPHHVEVDGTYVYPRPPESLLLRRSGIGPIDVTAAGGAAEARVVELGDEWVRLEGLSPRAQEFTVAVDGDEQVIIRTEECALFRPGGIAVSADEARWDLCTDAPLPASALVEQGVNIYCGSARIAEHLARLNGGWLREATQLSAPVGSPKSLYAGSFGELRGIVQPSLQGPDAKVYESATSQQAVAAAARRWLEQLVARKFGADGASRVRRYLSAPNPTNLSQLGRIMTSRLMPYIQAAQHQQRTEGD